MRVEFEYERGGALAYMAAWDVRYAKVFGRCETTTGIKPFGRLVQQVMEQEPYRKAHRVFWIVDNGSSHRGAASVRRLQGKYSNLILVHLLTTVPPSRLSRLATGANICRWFRSPRGNPAEHFTNYISEDEAACMARIGLKHVRLSWRPASSWIVRRVKSSRNAASNWRRPSSDSTM